MLRGAPSESHWAGAGEIHPSPGQYCHPNDKHGWLRIALRLRKSAAPFALSSIGLALIFAASYKLHLNTAVVVLLCLLVTVMHALADGLISSAIISLIAGTCLVYFFVPPLFSFRIEDPLEVVVFFVFLIVANGVAWLVSKAHEALRDSRRQLALAESVARLGLSELRSAHKSNSALQGVSQALRPTGRRFSSHLAAMAGTGSSG